MARTGKQVRQQAGVPRTPPRIKKGVSLTLFGHLLLFILHFVFFSYIF